MKNHNLVRLNFDFERRKYLMLLLIFVFIIVSRLLYTRNVETDALYIVQSSVSVEVLFIILSPFCLWMNQILCFQRRELAVVRIKNKYTLWKVNATVILWNAFLLAVLTNALNYANGVIVMNSQIVQIYIYSFILFGLGLVLVGVLQNILLVITSNKAIAFFVVFLVFFFDTSTIKLQLISNLFIVNPNDLTDLLSFAGRVFCLVGGIIVLFLISWLLTEKKICFEPRKRRCVNMWLFFKRDILWFLQGNKWKIIGLGMLLILAILINVVNAKNASGTIADVFLSFLKQDNGAENPLTSSLNWIIIQSLPVFLFGSYFYKELFALEEFITIRFNNRMLPFLSKILLIITLMLIYYFVIIGLVVFISFLFGIRFDVQPTLLFIDLNMPLYEMGLHFFVGGLALIMLQLLLSIIIKPFYAITVVLIIIVTNCFITNFWIIGSVSNVAGFAEANNWLLLSIQLVYIILVMLIGGNIYRKTDLYKLN